jgi:uncharacterized protein YprB with RNaseH-like and TPR domain
MAEPESFSHILFLDIETVPQKADYDQLTDTEKELWSKKAEFLRKTAFDTPASLYHRAGIYAEFGKIICIATGIIASADGKRTLRIKVFFGDDEKQILTDFAALLTSRFNESHHLLCAHNGKEFDFPYLARRMIVNEIKIPSILNISGKKPWEIQHLDTMDLWRFGDYKHFTPLNLLAYVLGIPSPKEDMDGSMVWFVYWKEKNMERIVNYCRKDVITLARIYLKMRNEPFLSDEFIFFVD